MGAGVPTQTAPRTRRMQKMACSPHMPPVTMTPTLLRATYSVRRVSMLAIAATLLASAVPVSAAQAQNDPSRYTGRVSGGVSLGLSQPTGAFDETTGNGFGGTINGLFALDQNSIFNWRAEFGFLNYGNVRQRVPLSPTLGNLIRVDLRTSNNIVSVLTGPQLLGPSGTVTPYATALGGFSAFWTESSVEGTNNQVPFASTTNSSDFSWAYGGAVGAYIRLGSGQRPVYLDFGARLLRHDNVTYLTANEVRASVAEGRDAQAIRSRVDFYVYYLGVQAIAF